MTAPAWGGIRCDPVAFNQKGDISMSTLITALKEHKLQSIALDDIQNKLADVKRAYNQLDDARAKLEEVQSDLRELDHPSFADEISALDDAVDGWIAALHPISEDMLDWTGRPDD